MSHALIIDDNPNNIAIMAQMLTLEGFGHTAIIDPTKIGGFLDKKPDIDVVFLDLEMPRLNGYQVKDLLKQNSQFNNVPIIAYSVHSAEMQTTRELGFDGFIGKPLDVDEFPSYFANIMAGKAVWVSS